MDRLRDVVIENVEKVPAHVIAAVYEHTVPRSMLRRLMAGVVAYHIINIGDGEVEKYGNLHAIDGFTRDMVSGIKHHLSLQSMCRSHRECPVEKRRSYLMLALSKTG